MQLDLRSVRISTLVRPLVVAAFICAACANDDLTLVAPPAGGSGGSSGGSFALGGSHSDGGVGATSGTSGDGGSGNAGASAGPGDGGPYDAGPCTPPEVLAYPSPGCDGSVTPVCVIPTTDACLTLACGCDGQLADSACGPIFEPWAYAGECRDGALPDATPDAAGE
jgi:hypothetical protein